MIPITLYNLPASKQLTRFLRIFCRFTSPSLTRLFFRWIFNTFCFNEVFGCCCFFRLQIFLVWFHNRIIFEFRFRGLYQFSYFRFTFFGTCFTGLNDELNQENVIEAKIKPILARQSPYPFFEFLEGI